MFGPRNWPTRSQGRPPSSSPPAGRMSLCVQHPRGPPEGRRGDAELQARHGPARLDHPGQLGQRGLRVLDVAQQIGEGQRVEAAVRKGQPLRLAGDQPDPAAQAGARHVGLALPQHVLGEVDADHAGAGPRRQLDSDPGRPRRHVQNERAAARPCRRRARTCRGGGDPVDHRAPPAAVLAHRQDLGQPVVAPRERREQPLREAVPVLRAQRDSRPGTAHRDSPRDETPALTG